MDNKKIGELIAKLRKAKSLTQQELGDKVGVGSRAVSKWERGLTIPDISIINELSQILGISSDELLSGKINKQTHTKEATKPKLPTKSKLLIILILTLIISTITIITSNNNKTNVYNLMIADHQKYKVDGYITYKNKNIELNINKFTFNEQTLQTIKIKSYQYNIKFNDEIIVGYTQTEDDTIAGKVYTIMDIEDILKINYVGKTKLSKIQLKSEKLYLTITLIDQDNIKHKFNVEMSLYKKEKNT